MWPFRKIAALQGEGPRYRRSWRFWLILLGVSAFITMAAPSIVFVLMITIIGIPIAIYLLAAPFLFLLAAGSRIGGILLGGGWVAHVAGLIATLALLAVPPLIVNRWLESTASSLVAGDKDGGTKPVMRTLAFRQTGYGSYSKDEVRCGEFCQRALLNKQVERFLHLKGKHEQPLDLAMMVDAYRIEPRASCPAVKLADGDDLKLKSEKRDWKDKRADELLQLEIAKGNCLIAETAPLGSADTVISTGELKKADWGRTLDPFVDTVKADRITIHERRGTAFVETYRWTGTVTQKLAPLYIPTIDGGAEFRAWPALARVTDKKNITEKYYNGPPLAELLTGRLALDLALRSGSAVAETREVLKTAITQKTLGTPAAAKLGADFLDGISRNRKMESEDFAIARDLLTDPSFPIPSDGWAAIKYAKTASPAYFDAVAASMFARLRAFATADPGEKFPKWREEVRHITGVFREMPRGTILKHRDDLEWLAKQDRVRVSAYQALIRLSEFGASAAPTLLWLIDDSQRYREKKGNNDDWQHPYLAGMIGLCNLGPEGSAMIQPLYDRLDGGVIANWASYTRLTINTLIGMGADPEEIWPHVMPKKAEYKTTLEETVAKARGQFDQTVKRALKKRDCGY